MQDDERCVACGEPIVVGDERVTYFGGGIVHESCFWLTTQEFSAPENAGLTVAQLREKVREAARARRMVKTVVE